MRVRLCSPAGIAVVCSIFRQYCPNMHASDIHASVYLRIPLARMRLFSDNRDSSNNSGKALFDYPYRGCGSSAIIATVVTTVVRPFFVITLIEDAALHGKALFDYPYRGCGSSAIIAIVVTTVVRPFVTTPIVDAALQR